MFFSLAISFAILADSTEPIVNVILFSIKLCTSSFKHVEDNNKISSFIPFFLSSKASSIVATANISIPIIY